MVIHYFRGNVTNNYILFGGFYCHIIRMNGDDSVRVIYDGTSAHANGNNSAIKTYIDTWYENNIRGTTNEQYIADIIFCND